MSEHRTPPPDAPSNAAARLVVLEGVQAGRKARLDRDVSIIGRSMEAHLQLEDESLSRRHAEIRRTERGIELKDLKSSNGTFVNGVRIEHTVIHAGDKIRLGSNVVLELTLYDPIEDELRARQRFEALGRMCAGVAHDFNNMIGAILSNLEYLRDLPPEQRLGETGPKECLADLEKASERAAELSRKLLGFARGTTTEGSIRVGDLTHEVAQLCRSTFGRAISIATDIESHLEMSGSTLDLHQVLMNLCLNARDAMPDGGTLRLSARRAGDEAIEIRVHDSGVGIDNPTLSRVFEPFFTTKRDGAGFGLGLATVRDIVVQLGGRIHIESQLHKGTSFVLRFPSSAARRARTTQPRMATIKGQLPAGLRILVVDDEDMVRRGARRLLNRSGHEVIEAATGEQALGCYREVEPDIVVLDLDMPSMNGECVLANLLSQDPGARVIIVSGHVDPAAERRLRAAGARWIMRKPWTALELLDAIEQAADDATDPEEARHTSIEEL
jgi:signal transduction histidine kinase/CheY-like chemotaxis protein